MSKPFGPRHFAQHCFIQRSVCPPALFPPKLLFIPLRVHGGGETPSQGEGVSAPSQVFRDIVCILVFLVTERNPLDPLRNRAIFLPLWFPQGLPLAILPDHSFRCVLLSFKFTEKWIQARVLLVHMLNRRCHASQILFVLGSACWAATDWFHRAGAYLQS